MALAHAKTRRWTVEEYQRLSDVGAFRSGERVELIDGEIIAMAAHNPPHREALLRGTDILVPALRDTHYVGVQVPVDIPPWSMPEPDFHIVPRDHLRNHDISSADLIIEVADSSLEYDRDEKAGLYARAGVKDYWISNLRDRQVEVHREPVPMAEHVFGHAYARVTVYKVGETISPLCRPDVMIAVADLLD